MTLAFAPERIEQWPLARLQPHAKNAKVHGADHVAKLAASVADFGWTVPCLVAEDGELIAGRGRVLAATQLGLTEAPSSCSEGRALLHRQPVQRGLRKAASARRGPQGLQIMNDALGDGFERFLYDACVSIITHTAGAIYMCMSSSELHTLHKAFVVAGGHWSTFIIWAKNRFTLGRSDYQLQFEPILYG
jgi:hypothetical protein